MLFDSVSDFSQSSFPQNLFMMIKATKPKYLKLSRPNNKLYETIIYCNSTTFILENIIYTKFIPKAVEDMPMRGPTRRSFLHSPHSLFKRKFVLL